MSRVPGRPCLGARAATQLLGIALVFCATTHARADSATEIVQAALELYEGITNYRATVSTFPVSSMNASDSEIDDRVPSVAFHLYYQRPDRHAVHAITDDPEGIFRVEPISTLARMQGLQLHAAEPDRVSGALAYPIQGTDPSRPGEGATVWIDAETHRLVQAAFQLNGVPLVTTQFRYPVGDDAFLPRETRSHFLRAARFYVNRIASYDVNTEIPDGTLDEK